MLPLGPPEVLRVPHAARMLINLMMIIRENAGKYVFVGSELFSHRSCVNSVRLCV